MVVDRCSVNHVPKALDWKPGRIFSAWLFAGNCHALALGNNETNNPGWPFGIDQAAPALLPAFCVGTALIVILGSDIGTAGVTPVSPTKPPPRVLVLYSDERLACRPISSWMSPSARPSPLGTNSRVEFHSEFLDAARFPGEEQEQRQRDYLRGKYRERRPDLLIAVSGAAVSFLVKYRAELFTGVPIVYCSVAGDPRPKNLETERIAAVPVFNGETPTLEMALLLHPDTRQVAVVAGGGRRDHKTNVSH